MSHAPRLLEHRVSPKIRSSAPRERMVHLGLGGDNWRVVVSLPALRNVLQSSYLVTWIDVAKPAVYI